MMLLDTTTLAEYLAESTAALQAQAVVDALADPVDVKVYDGSGNLMGSGVMATPWATQAAGVITVAEVTGFSVSASGTPDSDWYLRFESGTRWLRGGWGAEVTWSLPTWVAGQAGTIGTGTIGVPSNAAPSLVGAPSALSFTAGVGGTYDFSVHKTDPDSDTPLVCELLGTAYSGVTIDADGLLTVTGAATAAVRELTIKVSDPGGLSSEWVCTVTIGAVLPWNPGNYIGSSVDPSSGAVQTICNYVAARSYLKGANIRPFWGQLEPSQGVYNFDLIDEALATLEPAGKSLWVMIQTAKFNTSSSSLFPDFLPSYLNNATYDGGGYAQPKPQGTTPETYKYDLLVKLWNANVITRKVALITALHERYKNNPNVEGFIAAESALGLVNGEAGYTPSAFVTQLVRLFTEGRAGAPSKHLMMYLNYISGGGGTDANFQTICDSLRDNRWVCGGPDSLYTENGSTGRKFAIGVQGTTDYRGTLAMNSGDQTSGLNNTSYVNADWMNWCKNTAQSNWNIWVYLTGTANFNSLMTYLSSNPTAGYTSTKPSGY